MCLRLWVCVLWFPWGLYKMSQLKSSFLILITSFTYTGFISSPLLFCCHKLPLFIHYQVAVASNFNSFFPLTFTLCLNARCCVMEWSCGFLFLLTLLGLCTFVSAPPSPPPPAHPKWRAPLNISWRQVLTVVNPLSLCSRKLLFPFPI